MIMIAVSGEPQRAPSSSYGQQIKRYELNRRVFLLEYEQLRRDFPSGQSWVQALHYYRVFWEKQGAYRIGLPAIYLPDALPAAQRYGKYVLCTTLFPSAEQAEAVASDIKKTMARPESLTMDFKMGEPSVLDPDVDSSKVPLEKTGAYPGNDQDTCLSAGTALPRSIL